MSVVPPLFFLVSSSWPFWICLPLLTVYLCTKPVFWLVKIKLLLNLCVLSHAFESSALVLSYNITLNWSQICYTKQQHQLQPVCSDFNSPLLLYFSFFCGLSFSFSTLIFHNKIIITNRTILIIFGGSPDPPSRKKTNYTFSFSPVLCFFLWKDFFSSLAFS